MPPLAADHRHAGDGREEHIPRLLGIARRKFIWRVHRQLQRRSDRDRHLAAVVVDHAAKVDGDGGANMDPSQVQDAWKTNAIESRQHFEGILVLRETTRPNWYRNTKRSKSTEADNVKWVVICE